MSSWSIRKLAPPFGRVKTRLTQLHLDAIPAGLRPISGWPQPRIRRVTRGRMAAFVAAAAAVGARTPEVEFLRARHDIYRRGTPRDLTAPIPDTEISSAGAFVVAEIDRRHPSDRVFDGPMDSTRQDAIAAEIAFQRAAAEAAGAEVGRRAGEIDEDVQRVDRQLREIEEQLDQLAAERNDADAGHTRAIESGEEDLAPPRIPSIARILGWRCCTLAAIASECATLLFATANMHGIDPTALRAEWAQGAETAILGSALVACVTAGGAFILLEAARQHLAEAMRAGALHRAMERWSAALLGLLVGVVLIIIASLRADLGTAGHSSGATVIAYLVFAAVPLIAGTYVHARAERLTEQRRAALTRALTPDPRDVGATHRRAQEARLLDERGHLRVQRDTFVAKRNALNASVFSGDQLLRDIAKYELRLVDTFLDTIRASLAIDRMAFRVVARMCRRDHLLAGAQEVEQTGALVPIRRARRSA